MRGSFVVTADSLPSFNRAIRDLKRLSALNIFGKFHKDNRGNCYQECKVDCSLSLKCKTCGDQHCPACSGAFDHLVVLTFNQAHKIPFNSFRHATTECFTGQSIETLIRDYYKEQKAIPATKN